MGVSMSDVICWITFAFDEFVIYDGGGLIESTLLLLHEASWSLIARFGLDSRSPGPNAFPFKDVRWHDT
jgi:hypothetical protein